MILLDAGPLVALFDPREAFHERIRDAVRRERPPLITTMPVLTEAFHILDPSSAGSRSLRKFIVGGGVKLWHLDTRGVHRAMDLMEDYADQPMDLADATLVVAAEGLRSRRVLTLDRDFAAYRIRHGHRVVPFDIVRC